MPHLIDGMIMRALNLRQRGGGGPAAAFSIALALSGATVLGPAAPSGAVENDPTLIAQFDFEDAANGLTGSGAMANPRGGLTLVDGDNGTKAVQLGQAKWLSVTKTDGTPLLAGLNEVTISYDSMPTASGGNNGWAFIAQRDMNNHVYQHEHYFGIIDKTTGVVVERYDNSGSRDVSGNLTAAVTHTGWKHVDVVVDGTAASLFVDGELQATTTSGKALTAILGSSGGVLQLGKANWTSAGEYFDGLLDNVEVRNKALTEAEVAQLNAETALERLPSDITIEEDSYRLPGAEGIVTWTSNLAAVVIGADGRTAAVTRPAAGSPDTTGTLTASVTVNGELRTKQVQVLITAPPTPGEQIEEALATLTIPGLHDIRSSLSLPTTGADGLPITWTSSAPNRISPVASGDVAPGVVTRGDKDEAVTLTASIGGRTKSFTAVVRAAVQAPQTTDYLFAHFTGFEQSPNDEQIYFATSENGDSWTDTRPNGSPVLRLDEGDRGVRDPYLIRSPEGDTFYLIATDLSIYFRGGWCCSNPTETGSLKLAVWKSTDLVNWGEPELVDVASGIPDAGMAWAPEAVWDPVKKQYVVYWATKSPATNALGDPVNIYYATTRDFRTFSDPVKWIDREHSIIDTTVLKVGDWYYRASGDGQITIEKSKDLYATSTAPTALENGSEDQWSRVGTLQSIFNNNGYTGAQLEGPEFFEYNNDDQRDANQRLWGLLADRYSVGGGYFPFRTTSIGTASTSAWSVADDVNFGGLTKRHGTILPITRAELEAVRAATQRSGQLVDITAPTLTVTAPPSGTWHRVAPALEVTAADDQGREPTVWIRIADGDWRPYAGEPISGLSDHQTIVSVRAEDSVGNVSPIQTLSLGLDTAAPTASAVLDEASRTVTITAADATSSVATVEYSLQSSDWSPYTGPVAVGSGSETLRYRVTDAAGNHTLGQLEVPAAAGSLTASTPRVSGSPRVGGTLGAVTGAWAPAPVHLTYQWLRSGEPVAGARGATYRLVPADRGHRMSVEVTGTKPGYAPVVRTSSTTPLVGAGRLFTTRPVINGKAEVGRRLTALVRDWSPAPLRLTYQWFRSGERIAGATATTHRLSRADRGHRIAVRVVGRRGGYVRAARFSTATEPVR